VALQAAKAARAAKGSKATLKDSSFTDFDSVPLKEPGMGPTEVTNYLVLDIGGKVVNTSWTRTSEHGDVDSTFQIAEGPPGKYATIARYTHRHSSGEGWKVLSKRFDVKPPRSHYHSMVYLVDNAYGETQEHQALPREQLKELFGNPEDIMSEVAAHVKGKESMEHWEQFHEFWKLYA